MGPLQGVRVIEIAGIGPGPFCAMLLADLGGEVVRIDRPEGADGGRVDVLGRGRRSVVVDLKHPRGAEVVLGLVAGADVLIEGFRPAVAERLGIGPEACLARNPRLVYGRMTGWGQSGPLRHAAGHDIAYIALAGALHPIGPAGGPPVPPLNLVGDFGGGGMLLAFGITCALLEAQRMWSQRRGSNPLDGGAPFYGVYETADGEHVAVGALEPRFYAELLAKLGLDPGGDGGLPGQMDRERWPELRERLAAVFRTRTRAEWSQLLEGSDACVAPVLSLSEAPDHPHNRARGTFVPVGETLQPAPAPRFSRTQPPAPTLAPTPGQHTDEVLTDWGFV